MKKQISIASAFVAASGFSYGEIKINEYLSFEGFVAADYSVTENKYSERGFSQDESDNFFGVPEVEIDWLFNFGAVGGRVDLQHEDFNNGQGVEQAFMTYELATGSTLTAGRYASMLGYEDFERPGLHQYSYAYDLHVGPFGVPVPAPFGPGLTLDGSSGTYTNVGFSPGYNQGLKYTYESNGNFFGVSLQDSVFGYDPDRFGGDDVSSYGLEVAGAIQLAEGLRWFLGGAYEDTEIQDADKNYMLNTYLAYEAGPWTFGAELNYGESESGLFALGDILSLAAGTDIGGLSEKAVQGMIVANYAYSDCSSITGRISYSDHKDDLVGADLDADAIKYTLAHKYAFSENLALINEVSYVDGDISANGASGEFDSVLGAASLLFTF
jgi:hypothetical protein